MSDGEAVRMLELLKGLETKDREYARQWAVDWDEETVRASMDRMILEGQDLRAIEAWHAKIVELRADSPLRVIRKAVDKLYPPTESAQITTGQNARSPRYPSGIEALDSAMDGFYGATLLGGESGVGKSLLATGSSLLASMGGWRTFYGNCELKTAEISRRVGAFIQNGDRGFLSRWHCIDLFHGATLEKFICEVESKATLGDEKILLVIDSLNSFVRKMGSVENGYFRAIDDICAFAETAVRKSNGRVGVLLVSELNKAGGIRGGTSEYVCCLDVRMKHGDSDKEITEISTAKGREGGGWRNYGLYYPNHETCSFDPLDDPPEPLPPTHQERPDEWEM